LQDWIKAAKNKEFNLFRVLRIKGAICVPECFKRAQATPEVAATYAVGRFDGASYQFQKIKVLQVARLGGSPESGAFKKDC
jgi:hypothetical protein